MEHNTLHNIIHHNNWTHLLWLCPFWCTCGNKYEHSREVNNDISNKNCIVEKVYPYNMKTGAISIWWYTISGKNLVTLATRKPFTNFIGQLILLESVLAIHIAYFIMQYFILQISHWPMFIPPKLSHVGYCGHSKSCEMHQTKSIKTLCHN